ncbi:MAG: cytochrome b [Proteobacteria bacterium]|nr:cytochrome b [Pseudomonadota bacterium]
MPSTLSYRYGTVSMTFHWLIAALVLTNVGLGLSFDNFPRGSETLLEVVLVHKSIGLTVLVLSVLRLLWRLMHKAPPLPADMNPALKVLGRASHVLLYFLIIALPLTGWGIVSASSLGVPTHYFGLFDWPNLQYFANLPREQRAPYRELFDNTHVLLAWTAIGLIVLHISAALYHQFVRRDDVLRRMLPVSRQSLARVEITFGLILAFCLLSFVNELDVLGQRCYYMGDLSPDVFCVRPWLYWTAWILSIAAILSGLYWFFQNRRETTTD